MKTKQQLFNFIIIECFKKCSFPTTDFEEKKASHIHFDYLHKSPIYMLLTYERFRLLQKNHDYDLMKYFNNEDLKNFFMKFKNQLNYQNIQITSEHKDTFNSKELFFVALIQQLHDAQIDNQLMSFIIDIEKIYQACLLEYSFTMNQHIHRGEKITESSNKVLFQAIIYSHYSSFCKKENLQESVMYLYP